MEEFTTKISSSSQKHHPAKSPSKFVSFQHCPLRDPFLAERAVQGPHKKRRRRDWKKIMLLAFLYEESCESLAINILFPKGPHLWRPIISVPHVLQKLEVFGTELEPSYKATPRWSRRWRSTTSWCRTRFSALSRWWVMLPRVQTPNFEASDLWVVSDVSSFRKPVDKITITYILVPHTLRLGSLSGDSIQ